MEKLKRRVYALIRDDDTNSTAADIFDGAIIALILLNVVAVIIDTFPTSQRFTRWSGIFESVSVVIFTLEYAARLWTAPLAYPALRPGKARARYALRPMSVIDLISILPFYIPVLFPADLRILRLLRVVRLFRLFKVNRYNHALDTIQQVFKRKASQLLSSLFTVGLLIVISSVLMFSLEHRAQPGVFKNALDGLWWSLATLTSANYGDIYPVTLAGRLLSGLLALLGIGLIAVPTGIISAGFVEVIGEGDGTPTPPPTGPPSPPEEIAAYKALLDGGAITQSEYEAKKRQLLNQ